MDGLGDWELLSDDALLDFYGETHRSLSPTPKPKTVFQFEDYFSPNSTKFVGVGSSIPIQLLPVPIHFNPSIGRAPQDDEEVTKLPIESTLVPSEIRAVPEAGAQTNQVFFVKMKETDQFVDMKMDSPKSGSRGTILPQIEAGAYQFEAADSDAGKMSSPRMNKIEMEAADAKDAVGWEEESAGVNIWKWSLTGIGALCSFGVAAATVCIIVLGSQQKNHQQTHKARIQIYASDKRIKQVLHEATRLNEVISGTRGGVQLGRAHISYGGYYDGL